MYEIFLSKYVIYFSGDMHIACIYKLTYVFLKYRHTHIHLLRYAYPPSMHDCMHAYVVVLTKRLL
eukprot:28141_3